ENILYVDIRDKFYASTRATAKNDSVNVTEEEKTATVYVAEDQLSLAIGKEGQNVRLAAKLTGYKIDIKGPKDALEAIERATAALGGGKDEAEESSDEEKAEESLEKPVDSLEAAAAEEVAKEGETVET